LFIDIDSNLVMIFERKAMIFLPFMMAFSFFFFFFFNKQSLCSLHGLIRGENMELGRDSDTGGQVTFWQQYLICKVTFYVLLQLFNDI
jgi:hypothetical protein